MIFSVFLGDEYLGDGHTDSPMSHHYLCPVCGNIWARIISPVGRHGAMHRNCPEHPTQFSEPATLYYDFRFYKMLWPKAALARDFLYLLDTNKGQFITNNLPGISHEHSSAP